MADAEPRLVPVGTLAKLLNLSEVRIQQLVKVGIIVRASRGLYDHDASVTGYVRYLQEGNSGAASAATADGDGEEVSGDDYHRHRARLYKARADAAELEAQLLRGKLHEAAKVEKVWDGMIAASRAKLLALPRKSAGKVLGLANIAEVEAILEENVHEALHELADYDPGRVALDALPVNQSEVEASGEIDGERVG